MKLTGDDTLPFVRRFFVFDNVTGVRSSDGQLIAIRLAEKMTLTVERSEEGEDGSIPSPVSLTAYISSKTAFFPRGWK